VRPLAKPSAAASAALPLLLHLRQRFGMAHAMHSACSIGSYAKGLNSWSNTCRRSPGVRERQATECVGGLVLVQGELLGRRSGHGTSYARHGAPWSMRRQLPAAKPATSFERLPPPLLLRHN